MAHMISELTNEIYDASADANLDAGYFSKDSEGGVIPYSLILGVFVSLLPKVSTMETRFKDQILARHCNTAHKLGLIDWSSLQDLLIIVSHYLTWVLLLYVIIGHFITQVSDLLAKLLFH